MLPEITFRIKDLLLMNRPQIFTVTSKLSAAACYIGPAIMAAADIITIMLNRTFNPLKQTISGYAAGPYGWLEKTGIIIVAFSFFVIALNLLNTNSKEGLNRLRLTGAMLVIVAVGFLLLGIFNTNVIGTLSSFHGLIHHFSVIAVSVVFYLSCLIIMSLMLKRKGYKYFGLYSGLAFAFGLIVLFVIVSGHGLQDYAGLEERLIAGFNLTWIVLVGPQVIKLANPLQ
jgi:Protein of unknown function (DUF998)